MPAAAPSPAYALSFSEEARKTRRQLAPELQAVIFDVLDELAARPGALGERTRELVRGKGLMLYTHPDPPLEITYQLLPGERVLDVLHFAAPAFHAVKPVFISYSHRDVEWLEKVKKFLGSLEDQGLIRLWDDTSIPPGAEWLAEIRRSLETARAAVLLVSQDFLRSPFIQTKEVPALLDSARSRGTAIFWIPLSASTVEDSVLAKYQAALDPGRPLDSLPESQQNHALVELCKKLKQAVDGPRAG